jgi:hypothetical protein
LTVPLILPLAAHADPIDDFVLTGGGQTITYSLPATSSYPDFDLFNFFSGRGSASLNGVSGYSESSQYNLLGGNIPVTMILTIFGSGPNPVLSLYLLGHPFFTYTTVPASNPPGYLPEDIVATFTPGTYNLESEAYPDLQPLADYTLTITQEAATAPTPELSTLALLATGTLGLTAFLAKRKRPHHLFD